MTESLKGCSRVAALVLALIGPGAAALFGQPAGVAQAAPQAELAPEPEHRPGGEANLVLPDLGLVDVGGYNGRALLMIGLGISALGMLFGLVILYQLKNLPVHRSMREISELIYETCKTYLVTQGKFIAILEIFIAVVIVLYFGVLSGMSAPRVLIILLFSVIGILGSYSVAWFGIRVNTYANSRTAFASLEGKPYPVYAIPLKAGMSIGMLLISVELFIMLVHPAVHPRRLRRPVLHRLRDRRVAGRRGAAHRRRHLHQDRRHRLRPDEDRVQHQGRRRAQPGRDRRLHRRQRRRLGRAERRRLRDLRRDRRGAHHLHHAGRARGGQPGPAARLDLRHAHHDDHCERRVVPAQRGHRQGPLRQRDDA